MRTRSLVYAWIAASSFAACTSEPEAPKKHTCSDDTDCSGNAICDDGTCVDNDDGSTSGSTGGSGPGGSGSGGSIACDGGQLCGEACIDTSADPLHCGGCDVQCPPGSVCNLSLCVDIADCTKEPCVGLTYCDLATKKCLPGCIQPDQCKGGQTCNLVTHACECPPSEHLCGGACNANDSPQSCGSSCVPCATDPHGASTCNAGQCGIACDGGYHACNGACAASSSPASCGSSCNPCPGDANGTATCTGGACGLACNAGFWSCASGCCGFTQEPVGNIDASYVDIAVTSTGTPHVAYTGANGTGYGTKSGNNWSTQTLDAQGYRLAALALTPASQPWIAFETWVSPSFHLKVARKSGSSFVTDEPTTGGCCDSGLDIAAPSATSVQLAYNYDQVNNGGDVRAFSWNGTSWSYVGNAGYHASYTTLGLGIDSSGQLHLGFTLSGTGVFDTKWDGVQFSQTEVDSSASYANVKASFAGTHRGIVYCSASGVGFATFSGNAWSKESVAAVANAQCDVAVDANGKAHVVYSAYNQPLFYSTKENGAWKQVQLAASADAAAIAVDGAGNPHVVYAAGNALTYAHVE